MAHPEVLGHELTHAIQYYALNGGFLNSSQESSALSESFSDIFAVLVESALTGNAVDWEIGPPWKKSVIRSLKNPLSSSNPNAYMTAPHWIPPNLVSGTDCADPHQNSTVHSHWFYLLAVGDPPNVLPIGVEDAAQIAFTTMTVYLTPDATHASARNAEIWVAEILFGKHSQAVASVTNAWAQVNVGQPYVNPFVYSPSDGEVQVNPWPTTMAWQSADDENEWQIQISTKADFSSDVIERGLVTIGAPPVVQLPAADRPNLQPRHDLLLACSGAGCRISRLATLARGR